MADERNPIRKKGRRATSEGEPEQEDLVAFQKKHGDTIVSLDLTSHDLERFLDFQAAGRFKSLRNLILDVDLTAIHFTAENLPRIEYLKISNPNPEGRVKFYLDLPTLRELDVSYVIVEYEDEAMANCVAESLTRCPRLRLVAFYKVIYQSYLFHRWRGWACLTDAQ
jgi:hypothetical protein